ncbi:MAG: efflux RND transporter permease subunit [Spirochaetaceae bacterium]
MHRIFRRPELIVAAILAITAFFAVQIPELEINNNIKIFIPEDNPTRVAYERLKDDFGSQEQVDIAVTTHTETALRPEILQVIADITHRLEELDTVEDVQSATNADFIESTGEGMRAAELLEDDEATEESVGLLRRRILSWPEPYDGAVVSTDLESLQIVVDLVEDAETDEREAFYADARAILSEYEDTGLRFYMAGDPVITVLLKNYMLGDLLYLIPMVTIVVLLALYLSFRKLSGVILPIITVFISTIWALGVMSLLDIYFSMISTVIPVLLIAVGSAYVIHVFNHYYDEVRAERTVTGDLTPERHREIVGETVRTMGTPVAMSALTTAAGFASIATSAIVPMRHFGIINAVGVLSALIVTLTFVPSLLLLRRTALGGRALGEAGDESAAPNTGTFSRALLWFYSYFSGRTPRIIFFSLLIALISVWGLIRIVVDNSMIEYFDRDSEIRVADRFIRKEFSGTKTFSVVVSGDEEGALTEPEALAAMDELKQYLTRRHEEVGKVLSFSDFIRRMNRVMNAPDASVAAGEKAEASGESGESGESGDGEPDSFFEEEESSGESADTEPESFFEADAEHEEQPEETQPAEDTEDNAGGEHDLRTGRGDLDERPTYREFFTAVSAAYERAESLDMSARELVDLLYREFNYDGAAYDEIPTDPDKYPVAEREDLANLVSQYLLVYSGGLDDFADDSLEPSKARMLVVLRATDSLVTEDVSASIQEFAERRFPEGYEVSIAGFSDMESEVTRLIVNSQLWSLFSALVVVFVIVAVSNRSGVAGFYGIIPLSLAILINFGVMGLTGIKLNVATAMIASIAVGIGIDYSIHFLTRYRRERAVSEDPEEASKRTILTTGKAILYNAFAVAAGFAVLIASNFNPLRFVGVLVALTMFTSSLAALTVLPALLNLFRPRFAEPSEKRGGEE